MKECDLVLKGGVTSGIVYPGVIQELARSYRLVNIGGTSAGAIAAALAAAAEYHRQSGASATTSTAGYARLPELGQFLQSGIPSLFQPYPMLAPLFRFAGSIINDTQVDPAAIPDEELERDRERILYVIDRGRPRERSAHESSDSPDATTAAMPPMRSRLASGGQLLKRLPALIGSFFRAAAGAYPLPFWFSMAVALGFGAGLLGKVDSVAGLVGCLLIVAAIALLTSVVSVGLCILLDLRRLVGTSFGVCSGLRQDGAEKPALTDWLADEIDAVAGLHTSTNTGTTAELHRPLTVGDLRRVGVNMSTMTSDLASRRPYRLPFDAHGRYAFSEGEMRKLFPARIVDYLKLAGAGISGEASRIDTAAAKALEPIDRGTRRDLPEDLYRLPVGDAFPVVMIARLSLSFPLLLSTVPLYALPSDTPATADPTELAASLRRIVLSDGGLSSNFPIHFFDVPLPRRPTLGISLTYGGKYQPGSALFEMHSLGERTPSLPIAPVDTLMAFLWSLFDTAKDWQDNLQTQLPGYAERIMHIRLFDGEGGLNLDMPAYATAQLLKRGELAGEVLVDAFEQSTPDLADRFDESRYARAISWAATAEAATMNLEDAWRDVSNDKPWPALLDNPQSRRFDNTDSWRRDALMRTLASFAEIGASANERCENDPDTLVASGDIPMQSASLHVQASARDAADGSPCPAPPSPTRVRSGA
ncbi:MAG: hypothetical protein CSA54_00270 [Gammaproteobacteria bacterium]|nr:MAG: hypothetical protein CSA54_00270 [Gammaproteobacteria bacterium]